MTPTRKSSGAPLPNSGSDDARILAEALADVIPLPEESRQRVIVRSVPQRAAIDLPRKEAEFIAAVKGSAHTPITLSALVGYLGPAPLSAILLRRSISSTPLGLERILKVAEVIDYTGDLDFRPSEDQYGAQVADRLWDSPDAPVGD